MKSKITLAIALFAFFVSSAQQRTCGMKDYMEQKLQDQNFNTQYQTIQDAFQQRLQTANRNPLSTIKIPVAVHFPSGNESDRQCLEDLAQRQMNILNNDFKGTNSDISNWSSAQSFYPSVNTGSLDVEFIIATRNHPANTDNDLVDGGKAVTIGYDFGNGNDSDPLWSGYLNFVVKDIGTGLLGYSPLGGIPNNGDSIVMNLFAFGSETGCANISPSAPFNLGRTVTHELGHHYNLDHTWGNGGCSSDDNVADTPNIDDASYDCPSSGSVMMCGNTSLTMNFMDYVNDACMYMFTQGQAQRALAYINTIKDQYKTDVFNVLGIQEIEPRAEFTLAPNPAKDYVNLTFNKTNNDGNILIYNMLGKIVKTTTLKPRNNTRLFIGDLNNGVYFIKVVSNEKFNSKRLIINR